MEIGGRHWSWGTWRGTTDIFYYEGYNIATYAVDPLARMISMIEEAMLKIKQPERAPLIVRTDLHILKGIVDFALTGPILSISDTKKGALHFQIDKETLDACTLTPRGQDLSYKCPQLQFLAEEGVSISVKDFEIWIQPGKATVTIGEQSITGL